MIKIFIIEDDEIVAEIYKGKLQAEGYRVEVAHDGKRGYLRLLTFEPDLLLLDMMIPELSGMEILKLIRANDALQQLPVIAFSGSDEMLDEAKCLGATRVLSKAEFVPNQIVARITEVLAFRQRVVAESEAVFTHTREAWVPPAGRILVVEDDPVIMELVKDVMHEEGYTVVAAQDGGEGYRILTKDCQFLAGIFDVKMPSIQGTDLLRHMQTEKRLSRIPVLIMTGEQSMALQAESFSAGAAVFLPKPFTRAALRRMFRTLVSRKQVELKRQPALN
ncbi:MAG TPA: response regulator [Pyrinomonadaceae bacterium]|nr:response regulator [Pyrinomonadaceae bacterium]